MTDTTARASEHLPNGDLPGQEIREEWFEGPQFVFVVSVQFAGTSNLSDQPR